MKHQTHILLVKVGSQCRTVLEKIEGQTFDNIDDLENVICFDENIPMATEDYLIYTLSEFTEVMNNQDDDTLEEDILKIEDFWIGYVNLNPVRTQEKTVPVTLRTIKKICGWGNFCDVTEGNHYALREFDVDDGEVFHVKISHAQKLGL